MPAAEVCCAAQWGCIGREYRSPPSRAFEVPKTNTHMGISHMRTWHMRAQVYALVAYAVCAWWWEWA